MDSRQLVGLMIDERTARQSQRICIVYLDSNEGISVSATPLPWHQDWTRLG
jgi:hypothetical protein